MKYVKKLAEETIWNAGSVELFDLSRANLNRESREEVVTFIASECYGSEPNDRKKLYKKLLTEHFGKPTSSFEFIRGWDDTSLFGCFRNNQRLNTFEESESRLITPDFMTSAVFNGVATFRLKAPIFIARQIMRHRSFAYQEMSRRYQDDNKTPFEFWNPGDRPWGSLSAIDTYEHVIGRGERPEVARAILPQSTYTEFFIQGDIPAWANYFNVRLDAKAQEEHRELAKIMFGMLRKYKPRFFEHMHGYVDKGSEMGYNCDIGADRPDRWD